jgi:hypothetical protein
LPATNPTTTSNEGTKARLTAAAPVNLVPDTTCTTRTDGYSYSRAELICVEVSFIKSTATAASSNAFASAYSANTTSFTATTSAPDANQHKFCACGFGPSAS